MTNWNECPAVEQTPGKVSGAWVFSGTRIPLFALYENLASGATVEDFVEWFPGVEEATGPSGARTRGEDAENGVGPLKLLFDQGTRSPRLDRRWRYRQACCPGLAARRRIETTIREIHD